MTMSFGGCSSRFLCFLGASLVLSAVTVPAQAEPIRVTATFSILGDMVERIGGERVAEINPIVAVRIAITTIGRPRPSVPLTRPAVRKAMAVNASVSGGQTESNASMECVIRDPRLMMKVAVHTH